MYHPVEIERLSKAQISKLLNGHPVRVKHGKGHHTEVSAEQHKKLHKAHLKGSGCNLTLDPFQMHKHQHLRGHGFLDNVKQIGNRGVRAATGMANRFGHSIVNNTGGGFLDVINDIGHKAGSVFSAGNNIPFNPYDLSFQLGHDVIAPALMKGNGIRKTRAKPRGKRHGSGFLDDVGRAFDSPAVKSIGRVFQPLAEKALSKAGDYAIERAMSGEGIHRHRIMKSRSKTPKRMHLKGHGFMTHRSGSLAPAGYAY